MRLLEKATIVLLALLLLTPLLAGAIEYRPGERAAEELFYRGIGEPWVGGDPPKSSHWAWPLSKTYPDLSYRIIGYLDTNQWINIYSDRGESLQLMPGPGSYPIYGYYSGSKLVGLFMDLSGSGSVMPVYAYM
jgi:hypothetical protein